MARTFSKRIGVDELKKIILAANPHVQRLCEAYDGFDSEVLRVTPTVGQDISAVLFGTENLDFGGDEVDGFGPAGLCGFHVTPSGLAFLGFAAGDDWEQPVFGIIYHDGNELRGYIPKDGNLWNTVYMTAYGSENETVMPGLRTHGDREYEDNTHKEYDVRALMADIEREIRFDAPCVAPGPMRDMDDASVVAPPTEASAPCDGAPAPFKRAVRPRMVSPAVQVKAEKPAEAAVRLPKGRYVQPLDGGKFRPFSEDNAGAAERPAVREGAQNEEPPVQAQKAGGIDGTARKKEADNDLNIALREFRGRVAAGPAVAEVIPAVEAPVGASPDVHPAQPVAEPVPPPAPAGGERAHATADHPEADRDSRLPWHAGVGRFPYSGEGPFLTRDEVSENLRAISFKGRTLDACRALRDSQPHEGTPDEIFAKFSGALDRLCAAYGMPSMTLKWRNDAAPGPPTWNYAEGAITMFGERPSVLGFIRAFGEATGRAPHMACDWAVNLYRTICPDEADLMLNGDANAPERYEDAVPAPDFQRPGAPQMPRPRPVRRPHLYMPQANVEPIAPAERPMHVKEM